MDKKREQVLDVLKGFQDIMGIKFEFVTFRDEETGKEYRLRERTDES